MKSLNQFISEAFMRNVKEQDIKKLFEYPSRPGFYAAHSVNKTGGGNITVSYKDLTGDKMMLIISPDKYTVFAVGPSNFKREFRDWDKLGEFILYSAVKKV